MAPVIYVCCAQYGVFGIMGKKLYVGGLSWGTSEDALASEFEQFGQLEEVKIITDRETGRSRGFGFVTYVNDNDAKNAIDEMNGRVLDGRNLSVNEARERESREREPRGGGNRSGGGGGRGGYSNNNRW